LRVASRFAEGRHRDDPERQVIHYLGQRLKRSDAREAAADDSEIERRSEESGYRSFHQSISARRHGRDG